MRPLVQRGTVVAELNDAPIVALEPDLALVPASIQKIATSLWAVRVLGEHYHFDTGILEREGVLYVKGNGDPFLVSEAVSRLASLLKEKGKQRFSSIVLDDSRFELRGKNFSGSSRNPYEAINGALAVNFNTVYLQKTKTGVSSAEPQTPTLPIMLEIAKDLPPGTHRVSLPPSSQATLRYAGELMEALLTKNGIMIEKGWKVGRTPPDAEEILRLQSEKDLLRVIEEMLLYSNNFIANQLFLTCGAVSMGYPAFYAKSQKATASFFTALGIGEEEMHLEEGSGLARENRITGWAMLRILQLFRPYHRLFPEKSGLLLKSGTLSGVYSYAGYHVGPQSIDPFVIILNQQKNTRATLLDLLHDFYEEMDAKSTDSPR